MLKLMKLEWKTNQIGKHFRNAVILDVCLLAFILAVSGELYDNEMLLQGQNIVASFVNLLTNASYIIFTGVMLASFIISAYEKKTIHLLFSYPMKRQKILLSKITAVWVFCFTALVLTKVLIYAGLILTQPFLHISLEGIYYDTTPFWLNILLNSAVMVSIGFIALLVGMKMNSVSAAIVASILLACLTQGNIGVYTLADMTSNAPFYAVLLLLAAVSVFLSVCDAETKDVM